MPTHISPVSLPWLPRPAAPDRALLARADLPGLIAAARLGFSASELAAIGRRASKVSREAAIEAGLAPFDLLAIAPHTVAHLADTLRATALRHGLFLEVRVAEHEAVPHFIKREQAALAARPPNAVLLALSPPPRAQNAGSADEEAFLVAMATAVAGTLIAHVRESIESALIVETIAGDASAPQAAREAWLPGSSRRMLERVNTAIASEARAQGALVHDVAALADLVGHATWHPGRFGPLAQYPFAPECAPLWADRLCSLLAALTGRSRRVLVLDLDETLWGGIVGDDGIEGIVLGPPSPRGEAHLAIQRAALDLKSRGAVLAISSRNDPAVALDAVRRHPAMLIGEDDIAALRISWGDKAQHLRELSAELKLAPSAFVVLDDDAVERKRVREAFPEAAVPELPPDPADWLPVFQSAGYFEDVAFSAEDRKRTKAYRAEAGRAALAAANPDGFLASLDMTVSIAPLDALSRPRAAQLLAKSNQFNLTTRRYSEAELAALEGDAGQVVLTGRVRDMFGDSGLVSVVIALAVADALEIEAWVMSCRVLGRRVEEAMLAALAAAAHERGFAGLVGTYRPSARNRLVADHYARFGFAPIGVEADGATRWRLDLTGWQAPELPFRLEMPR